MEKEKKTHAAGWLDFEMWLLLKNECELVRKVQGLSGVD